jgi:hypothetical protein
MRIGASAPDVQPLAEAARQNGTSLEVVSINEPAVAAAYERRLVLVRPDGHVAWRGDGLADPHTLIGTVCGLGDPAGVTARRASSQQVAQVRHQARDTQDQERAI